MNPLLKVLTLATAASSMALPASAQFVGPRGGSFTGSGAVVPNAQGGLTGDRRWTVNGPNGGSSTWGGAVQTDGQGNYQYGRQRTIVTPKGQTHDVTGTGSSSYDPETGLTGSGTHTVNGNTYNTTTSGGTTTVTNSSGNSQTFVRPRFRR